VPVLLSTAYFPPISYFAALSRMQFSGQGCRTLKPVVAYLESNENYQKQSYRNRCHFYSASGMQSLSFPVVHEGRTHSIPVSKIKVDWSTPWLQQHKRAIVSAYRTSAFFEYYQDELFDIMDRRPETLWEYNLSIIRFFIEKIGLAVDLRYTGDFSMSDSSVEEGVWKGLPYNRAAGACDLREVIHPKRPDDILERLGLEKPYFQVFSRKYGFIPNLSIMDLLFNEGTESIAALLSYEDCR